MNFKLIYIYAYSNLASYNMYDTVYEQQFTSTCRHMLIFMKLIKMMLQRRS